MSVGAGQLPEREASVDAALPPPTSVSALLDAAVARFPSAPALDFMGRRWTYAALGRLVERAACGLQRIGVVKGTRVGLCLPNTPYSVILYFAALKAGAVVVNYNPLYVERELLTQMRDSGTIIMAVPNLPAIHGKVARVAAEAGLTRIIVCPIAAVLPPLRRLAYHVIRWRERVHAGPLDLTFVQLIAGDAPPTPVAIDPERDVAVLQYTGGTTGVPKGAMLTHANLTANSAQVIVHAATLQPGRERILGVLPLFHVFAMTCVMNCGIALGAELVLLPRFEIRQLMRTIARTRPSVFPAVPTIYGAINTAAEHMRIDLTSIRYCTSGGAPLPAEVAQRFEQLTGGSLTEGYGLSETSPVVSFTPPGRDRKPGSVGPAVPGTVIEIRDPSDPSWRLGVGEKGEICIRGPQVMQGYWNRPEVTREAFFEGALRTGDIGYLDADNYLFLIDRIKDVILCGGYNVYPRVLEEALYQHEAVAEAVVIGIPDPYRGQSPKAFVTLRAGRSVSPEALREFLKDYVSPIELPKEIEIRASLAKTMIGKLSKKALEDEQAPKGDRA